MARTRPNDLRWARVQVTTLEYLVPLVTQPAEQEEVFAALVKLRRDFLPSGDPGFDAPRYWSAVSRLWSLRWRTGNDEARDPLLEAVRALRALVEDDPRVAPNRTELARALYGLSQGHAMREEWKAARTSIEESLELLRDLHREVPRETLSRRTAAEALALCAEDEAADPEEQEVYASKAVAALEEAVRRGLRDPSRIRAERSFRSLRGRKDFEGLLRRLGR